MKKERSQGWLRLRAELPGMAKAWLRRVGAWFKRSFSLERREALQVVRESLPVSDPTLMLLLGVCFALAATTTLQGAVCMGLITLAVLLCAELTLSLVRRVTPPQVFLVSCVAVSATFATAAELLVGAWFPALSTQLGIFIPLTAVNSVVLSRLRTFAPRHTPGYALLDGAVNGLGFGLLLALVGALREVLGSGTIWGKPLFGGAFPGAALIVAPCGGLILLGCLAAAGQWIRGVLERRREG